MNEGIEPKDLAPAEVHEKLISASAKLILLRMMLPKLRERGHRVLLFSQVCFLEGHDMQIIYWIECSSNLFSISLKISWTGRGLNFFGWCGNPLAVFGSR